MVDEKSFFSIFNSTYDEGEFTYKFGGFSFCPELLSNVLYDGTDAAFMV